MAPVMAHTIPFIKMHGLGNDFIIIDERAQRYNLNEAQIAFLCDRKRGIGADQIMCIQKSERADAYMDMYNSDGRPLRACGNGTRSIAWLMAEELGRKDIVLESVVGLLKAKVESKDAVTVNMGKGRTGWQDIPLTEERDTMNLDLGIDGIPPVICSNIGNAHAVLFVNDVKNYDLEALGPKVEYHPLFTDRANFELIQILEETKIRMRVWERGAGVTLACGSGACGSVIAGCVKGHLPRNKDIEVILDGGTLVIRFDDQDEVHMTGEANLVYEGVITL